ncbi:DUF2235 domain-containing protein [Hymenobacter weizhouensis]|uniref:DUF2235 domain-containing protein n=1 Tax=Hymenobacter sp. YIM 151500-1 TaxID=2987689 RepID=UPI002225D3A0|nr:DUF2235 domain-containing protein [Hymenobacter sp. YIM 151500-1]UYZ64935.1 DUF2235 domain-containing protein [Hymenobacter sp. YIM 151500-1]
MGTVFNSLLDGPPSGIGKVVVGEEPETDDREPVRMRAAVFFDGTQNNRTNIETRLANATATVITVNGRQLERTGSFMSFYSNVAIMQYMHKIEDKTLEVSIYVEGIGTIDNDNDDNDGLRWGAGPTGVPAKVTRGITLLAEQINEILQDSKKRLEALTVDAFGFSRGAAAARHFVSRRSGEFFADLTNLSATLALPVEAITINFVGLYDTVSSYGGQARLGTVGQVWNNVVLDSFSDDVDELRLALRGVPKRVVQLGAAEEYRKSFARTSITTSREAGVGFECLLPGVHSDIGGSYLKEEVEVRAVDAYERQRLIDEGWYLPAQVPLLTGLGARMGIRTRMTGTRTVKHDYQFIPLSIMMQLAQKFEVTFKSFEDPKFADYRVPEKLNYLSTYMHQEVLRCHDTKLGQEVRLELTEPYHWVRNEYLHRSAHKGLTTDGIAFAGREKNGLPDREIIYDDGRRP